MNSKSQSPSRLEACRPGRSLMSLAAVCARGPKRVRFSLRTKSCPAPLAAQTALAAPGHATSSARNRAGHMHGPVPEPKTVSFSILWHRSVCLQHHLLEATLVAYRGRGSRGTVKADPRRQKRRDQTHAMSQVRRELQGRHRDPRRHSPAHRAIAWPHPLPSAVWTEAPAGLQLPSEPNTRLTCPWQWNRSPPLEKTQRPRHPAH